ncbi:MAG: hypothetical protein RMI34_02385 [Chloroherpetonaceae bacterium]|nr:hypothetical protein [Chloroherpetonaceae bacterium]MCS7211003.1 hypothetical protein [Chloroherpetonaceae bacterium]MDW8018904.1 hypothetical protein [Chloroherpetonaceae bacterium]MDW8467009.1 hypothetical protein [Chloroherpetonaceae bacterium]
MSQPFVWLLSLLAFAFPAVSRAQVYPEWFLYPSRYPNTVIGFTYNRTPAEIDAARMYCVYRECIASGTYIVYTNEQNDQFLIHSDYYYYFPDSLLQVVQDRLYQIDCFITSVARRDMACLFSLDSTLSVPRKFLDIKTLPEPDWIQKRFWIQDGYLYGVGFYPSRGAKNDAWKTAEEQAMFALLTNTAVKLYSIRIDIRSTVPSERLYETATALKLKFQLRNIEVVERWNSLKDEMFYVLVRIKQSDLRSPFLVSRTPVRRDSLRAKLTPTHQAPSRKNPTRFPSKP